MTRVITKLAARLAGAPSAGWSGPLPPDAADTDPHQTAVDRSIELGFGGRIDFHSLPQAKRTRKLKSRTATRVDKPARKGR